MALRASAELKPTPSRQGYWVVRKVMMHFGNEKHIKNTSWLFQQPNIRTLTEWVLAVKELVGAQ